MPVGRRRQGGRGLGAAGRDVRGRAGLGRLRARRPANQVYSRCRAPGHASEPGVASAGHDPLTCAAGEGPSQAVVNIACHAVQPASSHRVLPVWRWTYRT